MIGDCGDPVFEAKQRHGAPRICDRLIEINLSGPSLCEASQTY